MRSSEELEESQEDRYQSPGDAPRRQKPLGGLINAAQCLLCSSLGQSCPGIVPALFLQPGQEPGRLLSLPVGCGGEGPGKGHSAAGSSSNPSGCGKCPGPTFSPTAPPGSSSSPTLGLGALSASTALDPSLLEPPPSSAIPSSAPRSNSGWARPRAASWSSATPGAGKGSLATTWQSKGLFGVTQSHEPPEEPVGKRKFQPPQHRSSQIGLAKASLDPL